MVASPSATLGLSAARPDGLPTAATNAAPLEIADVDGAAAFVPPGNVPSETVVTPDGFPPASEAAIVTTAWFADVPPMTSAFCTMWLAVRLPPALIIVLPVPSIFPSSSFVPETSKPAAAVLVLMMLARPLPPVIAELGPDSSRVPVPSIVTVGCATRPFARVRMFVSVSAVFQTLRSAICVSELAPPATRSAAVLPTEAAAVLPMISPLSRLELLSFVTSDNDKRGAG